MKMEKTILIKEIESEIESFEKEKKESNIILETEKNRFINEVKSGSIEEMIKEVNERENKKLKESTISKLLKLF